MFALKKKEKRKAAIRLLVQDAGQASAEYVIAVFIGLVIMLALAGLVQHFSAADGRGAKHVAKTYSRAPHTLPHSGIASEQWLKDLIMH